MNDKLTLFGDYLRNLVRDWFAWVSGLSMMTFFVPRLNDYWQVILGVSLASFLVANFRLYAMQWKKCKTELDALKEELAAERAPRFETRILEDATTQVDALLPPLREALQRLFIAGQMTDEQMRLHLATRGYNMPNALERLARETTLVQRAVVHTPPRENVVRGYMGPYVINERYAGALESMFS